MERVLEAGILFWKENSFLLDLVIILIAVKGLGAIARWCKQPMILGSMFAGIIIGPAVLGWVEYSSWIEQLADIGVILLMFLAGLETDWPMFKSNIGAATLVALGGVIIPALSGWWLGSFWGYHGATGMLIGIVLLATSVSITVESLRELGWLRSKEGMTILGAAVLDDILGLVVLSVALNVVLGNGSDGELSGLFIKIISFFLMAIFFHCCVMKRLVRKNRGPSIAMILVLVFSFALLAKFCGLASIIGAYFVGIIIGQSSWGGNRLTSQIEFLGNNFFFPIFFANLGLVATFEQINGAVLSFGIVLTVVAILSKIIGAGAGALMVGNSIGSSLLIGTGMVSRGEVALLVSNIGFSSGLFDAALYTLLLLVTIITTVITPLLIKIAIRWV